MLSPDPKSLCDNFDIVSVYFFPVNLFVCPVFTLPPSVIFIVSFKSLDVNDNIDVGIVSILVSLTDIFTVISFTVKFAWLDDQYLSVTVNTKYALSFALSALADTYSIYGATTSVKSPCIFVALLVFPAVSFTFPAVAYSLTVPLQFL